MTKKAELEVVSCSICGSDKSQHLFDAKDYVYNNPGQWPVATCEGCGVIFMNPRIPPSEIGSYYPNDYYTIASGAPGQTSWGRALFEIPPARRGYNIVCKESSAKQLFSKLALPYTTRCALIKKLPVPVDGGTILDVGCGNGEMLTRYARLGWKTFGVEISPASAKFAAEAGHEMVVGEIFDGHYADEQFDAVTLWDSLEHIHNPMEVIQEVKRVLKPGGRIYISVPNVGSKYAKKFRDKWYMFTAPVHYYHYTGETLTKLLKNAGFSDVEISYPLAAVGMSHTLHIVWRDRPTLTKLMNNRLASRMLSWYDRFLPDGHVDAVAVRPASTK